MSEIDKSAGAPGASRCSVVEQAKGENGPALPRGPAIDRYRIDEFVVILGEIADLMRVQREVLDEAIQGENMDLVVAARQQAERCGWLADKAMEAAGWHGCLERKEDWLVGQGVRMALEAQGVA